jgi:integrase
MSSLLFLTWSGKKMPIKFTEKSIVSAICPAGKSASLLWSADQPGFGLRITARGVKSWIAQRTLAGGIDRRVTLGRWPAMTLTQARKAATQAISAMMNGVDLASQKRTAVAAQQRQAFERITLRAAMEDHLTAMKADNCADRSMSGVKYEIEKHLADWLDRPLVQIRREDVVKRHRELSIKQTSNGKRSGGPVIANRIFRQFRACWNTTRRVNFDLPECPTAAIEFNRQFRKRQPIDDLSAWYGKVQTIENPIRRDFHLFVLLTGLRGGDAKTVRFSEIDWDKGTLHRPCPKGGEARAFTIPLSVDVLSMLAKRQLENQSLGFGGSDYVFPSRRRSGMAVTHLTETKEQRAGEDGPNTVLLLPTTHRSRDTFITVAMTEAAVDPISVKCLVNHSLPGGDVTTGYIRPSLEHLLAATQRVTDILLAKMGVRAIDKSAKVGA